MRKITFHSLVFVYPGMAAWRFIRVPREISADITKKFGKAKRGWGSLPVTVTVGKTTWETSIFPDAKSSTYLLPLKAAVRKKEKMMDDERATVTLQIRAGA